MQSVYQKDFHIRASDVDRYGRLKVSNLLLMIQQVGGEHSDALSYTYDSLAQQGIFWAVIRHRVQITRLPHQDEVIKVETWPMPTTRAAYPRATVAYDQDGNELFSSVCLWILMDLNTRTMLVPKNSGILIDGIVRGNEIAKPGSLAPKPMEHQVFRNVVFSDLDRNGHMNNTRYIDWCQDLLPSAFHGEHPPKELSMCYINEALEGQNLDLNWKLEEDGVLLVDIHRKKEADAENHDRIFAAKIVY